VKPLRQVGCRKRYRVLKTSRKAASGKEVDPRSQVGCEREEVE